MTWIRFKKSIVEIGVTAGIFAIALFGGLFLMSRDYTGTFRKSEAKAEILTQVDAIEQAYFGISPYWLKRYKITVENEADTNKDTDKDGLTLKQEYLYLTDPTNPDSDGDGYDDGREVKNGYSPTGEGRLDMNKNGINDQWEEQYGLPLDRDESDTDTDGDKLTNKEEYALGTNPKETDTDKDGFDDGREVANGFDPSIAGEAKIGVEIFITKIGVAAPVIIAMNPSENALQKDLENGVVRYPKTATPGQAGNTVISGHSSNYAWAKGQYNYIFKNLNNLEIGDTITVKNTLGNGKSVEYSYNVTEKFVSTPEDARIFQNSETPTMTLVTCWPLNTDWKRLVVKTKYQG